jgi:hypothetical protein
MPAERQTWSPKSTVSGINAGLGRVVDVLDAQDRVHTLVENASAALVLTYVQTLVESDTTAGAVTLTFPSAATHPGFRVTSVKTAGGNTLTVHGLAVTTFASWASTGSNWRRVG